MRLATYNVLCPDFAAPPPDGGRDFYAKTRAFLPWADRWPKLVARIAGLGADVVCLQEVPKIQWDRNLRPALEEKGYACWFAPRPGTRPDGTALLVRAPWRMDALESLGFPDDSEKTAVLGVVGRSVSERLLVASVHLKWSEDGAVPFTQLAHVVEAVERRGERRVVIAGDLNVDVVRHPEWPKYAATGWKCAHPDDGRATWIADGRAEKTDAILVRNLEITAALPYPDIPADPGLPSATEPSDHLPLAADLAV